jgi:predicted nucleotidyltransferase component of viral defense system
MYPSVLDRKRRGIIKRLHFLSVYGFYLAGGTGLALQLGHRTSLDFNFYTQKQFDTHRMYREFEENFNKIEMTYIDEETLRMKIDSVEVALFVYNYPLIRPVVSFEGIDIASLEDISAMKVVAISQRGLKRDFIDIYFLMQKFGLKRILEFAKEKYRSFNPYVAIQGLLYFDDAERDPPSDRYRMLRKVDWKEIKRFIIKEVDRCRREM